MVVRGKEQAVDISFKDIALADFERYSIIVKVRATDCISLDISTPTLEIKFLTILSSCLAE